MKRYIVFCSTAILILSSLLIGCTNEKIEQLNVYEMESFQETNLDSLKVIPDPTDISIFNTAFKRAKKNPGIADMADPHYKVELGKETYFLWITEESGTIENVNDTHTTYSLSKESAGEVYQLMKSYY
ncbi:hypothetical protein DL346_01675 [Paenibacillus montanisoli]|uniref:YhfM-like domain-containing protein n=2 Tax=Paenibacillus montanisoli TaxID=2081970 RepID=A0A328U349_9BACL|nr:hypothetical protein DL346_01675 [Paenibacillus montanisoli]